MYQLVGLERTYPCLLCDGVLVQDRVALHTAMHPDVCCGHNSVWGMALPLVLVLFVLVSYAQGPNVPDEKKSHHISLVQDQLDSIVVSYFIKKSIEQKDVETSLIERFLYPKLGPGQLWEEVAEKIKQLGGEIHHNCDVVSFSHDYNNISSVTVTDTITGEKKEFSGDYFFSTMPVKNLVAGMNPAVPANIREVANGLVYRDFITVGLLLKELKLKDAHHKNGLIKDNWIYIQERDVKIGRLQVFNNWSPHMVAEPGNVWIGLEYFCNEGDELWQMPDDKFIEFAINELVKIEIIDKDKVLDSTILREKKTYPAYFGTYNRFDEIRSYLDRFENLFLIGRNGMHKYNNSDHSMLTAMTAVDNIIIGETSKDNIWSINTEQEYHEKKKVA